MSLSFREQVAEDFRTVLLNTEEFGRMCEWNGGPLQIVESAAPPIIESGDMPGVLLNTKEVICRIEDLPRPPTVTETVVLDGEKWGVADVRKLFGHYLISLARKSS